MSNRQQRRAATKLQHDPKVKSYTDRFAMDLSKILVNHFDKAATAMENGEQVDLNFDEESKKLLKEKGEEFGRFFQGFAADVKNDIVMKEKMQQQQRQQLKVNIK